MKNKLHRHLVTCRLCQLEQGHYCPALSEKTAQADVGRLMRHLSDKMWFSSVRAETLQLILDALDEAA